MKANTKFENQIFIQKFYEITHFFIALIWLRCIFLQRGRFGSILRVWSIFLTVAFEIFNNFFLGKKINNLGNELMIEFIHGSL